MKTLIILLLLLSGSTFAQSVKRDEQGNFISVAKTKEPPQKTTFWYKDSKGVKHDVYVTSTGRHFVLKVSAKTGKEYRYYLEPKQVN